MMNKDSKYKKDQKIEDLFSNFNQKLSELESEEIASFDSPRQDVIFIVGPQRSGTTLLMQLIANRFIVNYPDNLIARFWKAPYLGAQLKSKLDYNPDLSLKSDLGFTNGIAQPHEFGYFWKRWFDDYQLPFFSEKNSSELNKELAAWQSINEMPLVFKNLIQVVPNLDHLAKSIDNCKFIFVSRDDLYVIQSTLQSRKKLFGNTKSWFGIKPNHFSKIIEQSDPLLQCTEQVFYLNQQLSNFKKSLNPKRYCTVNYEKLVDNPNLELDKIESHFVLNNKSDFNLEDFIDNRNNINLNHFEIEKVMSHLSKLEKANKQ